METKPEELYLDLLKKALTFSLWPEPPIDLAVFNYSTKPIVRMINSLTLPIINKIGLTICKIRTETDNHRHEGKMWPPGYGDTMIGVRRLENLQFCANTVIEDGIDGDFLEAGVWRGGACIFLRAMLTVYNIKNRKVILADSFKGLPKPNPEYWPNDKNDRHFLYDFLAVSREEVENNFRKYGLLDDQVVFIEGFFKDTLPTAPINKLSILRLDGDMYESTMVALEFLYPKLTSGGFCLIDDYSLKGAKEAVHDYRSKFKISEEIVDIDWTGIYWRKM